MKSLWDKYLEKKQNEPILLRPGETLLHHYTQTEDIENCKKYLEFVNHRDFIGNTPFMVACLKSNQDLVKLFIESGADTTIEDNNGKDYYFKTFSHENNSPKRFEEIVKMVDLNRFNFYSMFYKKLYSLSQKVRDFIEKIDFTRTTITVQLEYCIDDKSKSSIEKVFGVTISDNRFKITDTAK